MLRTISADAALGELRANGVIADARIDEPLSLRPLCDGDTLNWPVSIVRCSLKELDASCVEFAAPVVFERCQIEKAQLFAAYFLPAWLSAVVFSPTRSTFNVVVITVERHSSVSKTICSMGS